MFLRTVFGIAIVPLALTLLLLIVIYVLRILLPSEPEGLKHERYEAGNPPSGRARISLGMQYFGFLLLFLAAEPVLVLAFISFLKASTSLSLLLYLCLVTFFTPPLLYAYRLAKSIDEWKW